MTESNSAPIDEPRQPPGRVAGDIEEPADVPRSGRATWIRATTAVLLTVLVFFVAAGDPPPHRNEAHYLTRLKHFWQPEWVAGDLFLESRDAHGLIVWVFGGLTRVASLETTAWVGRFLAWTLLAWGWCSLLRRMAPGVWWPPLGAALLVFATEATHFGGEWVIGGFEAKSLAYAPVLFALRAACDGLWNRAWLLLGLASALHALVGGWSVVALAFAWTRSPNRAPLSRMLPGLLGGGLLALLGVVPALMLDLDTPAQVVRAGRQVYVFDRLAHHLAPLTKPPEWLAERAARHLAIIVALVIAQRGVRRLASVPRRTSLARLIAFAWGAELISATGLLIELTLWSQPAAAAGLLRYYWFRLADIAAPVAVVAAIVSGIREPCARRQPVGLAAAVAAVCVGIWGLAGHVANRLDGPVAPADAKMVDPAAWIAMCDWVRANTEPSDVFLVPRISHSFKWRAERPEVVTYKDVPQNASDLVEWRRRFFDVYQIGEWEDGSPRMAASLADLGADRLKELGRRYGAAYALDQAPHWQWRLGVVRRRVSLPVVHRVGPYTLYRLPPPGDGATSAGPSASPDEASPQRDAG